MGQIKIGQRDKRGTRYIADHIKMLNKLNCLGEVTSYTINYEHGLAF